MEVDEDGDDLFNTEALSFDSTLEGLIVADYMKDPAGNFTPPSSEALMSTQENVREDLGFNNGGDTGTEDEKATNDDAENLEALQQDVRERDPGTNDVEEGHEVVEENSLQVGFAKINVKELKAKREKNLAQKRIGKQLSVDSKDSVLLGSKPEKRKSTEDGENKDAIGEPERKFLKTENGGFGERLGTFDNNDDNNVDSPCLSDINGENLFNEKNIGDCIKSRKSEGLEQVDQIKQEFNNLSSPCFDDTNSLSVNVESDDKTSTDKNGTGDELEKTGFCMYSEEGETSDVSENVSVPNEASEIATEDTGSEMQDDEGEDTTVVENNEETEDPDNEDTEQGEDLGDDYEDSDMDDNEIYAWLEEGVEKKELKEDKDETRELKDGEFTSREKKVLEAKGDNPFEVLPEGWVMVTHNSGMPVYLHKQSRVITLSKPYFIGTGSVRKHTVLLSAVPCLHYRRALEKEETEVKEEQDGSVARQQATEGVTSQADKNLPTPVLQSAEKMVKMVLLEPDELHDYCEKLFQFKTVTVKKFKTWKEKREHLVEERKKERKEKEKNLPSLPSDTKLITCPLPADGVKNATSQKKKEFILNPVGKTPVCILHEYTQHVLRVQPSYVFKEIENAETPFKASVVINGIQYGSGVASAKRLAKAEAAKATLAMFLPSLAAEWKDTETEASTKYRDEMNADLSYFEEVLIEDPRVTDLCDKAALPKPVQVLQECLRRNFGMGDTNIQIEKKLISNQKTEFSLTVGKRTATVVCKNKREGKQRAAQAMLQLLHPNLKNWAAILRLYSKTNVHGFKEREEEVTGNQEAVSKMKNFEILEKLKEAMRKLQTQRKSMTVATAGCTQTITQPLDL